MRKKNPRHVYVRGKKMLFIHMCWYYDVSLFRHYVKMQYYSWCTFFSKAICLLRSIINLCLKHQWNIRSFCGNINSPEQIHFQHSMKDMRFFFASSFQYFKQFRKFPVHYTRFISIKIYLFSSVQFNYASIDELSIAVVCMHVFSIDQFLFLLDSNSTYCYKIPWNQVYFVRISQFGFDQYCNIWFPKKILCTCTYRRQ